MKRSEVGVEEDEVVVAAAAAGGSFYTPRRSLVIHCYADVICDAFIHVEEGNRGRIESNRRPLTSL